MLDRPDGTALIEAVARFLRDEVMPELDGAMAFKVRVAANALDLARREAEQGPALEAAEVHRLEALLDESGTLDSLNRALCERIASGEMSFETPGLAQHVWETTLGKLAVEQPRYAAYRREIEDREGTA